MVEGTAVGAPIGGVPIPGTPMPGMPIPVRSIIIVLDMLRTPFGGRPCNPAVSFGARHEAKPEARPSGLPRLRADYRQTSLPIATILRGKTSARRLTGQDRDETFLNERR